MSETFSTKKNDEIESLADDIEASAERRKMISSSSYGLLALFFGWLGVHDFSAERYGYGCVHLIMAAIALCTLPFDISNFLPPTLLFISWLWAIWEAIRFRKTSDVLYIQTHEANTRDYIIKAKVADFFYMLQYKIQPPTYPDSKHNCFYHSYPTYIAFAKIPFRSANL